MRTFLLALGALALAGCATPIPAKYQVTDLQSGKSFTTYEDMGKENMLGYNFKDLESGEWVMLRSYTKKHIGGGGTFESDSPDAMEYQSDMQKRNPQMRRQTGP